MELNDESRRTIVFELYQYHHIFVLTKTEKLKKKIHEFFEISIISEIQEVKQYQGWILAVSHLYSDHTEREYHLSLCFDGLTSSNFYHLHKKGNIAIDYISMSDTNWYVMYIWKMKHASRQIRILNQKNFRWQSWWDRKDRVTKI